MEANKEKIIVSVDEILRLSGLPTFSEYRETCKRLIEADKVYFGSDESKSFYEIQDLVNRSY